MTPGARWRVPTRPVVSITLAWLAYVALLWALQAGIYPALGSDRAVQVAGLVAGVLVTAAAIAADRTVLDAYRAPRRHWIAALVLVATATVLVAVIRQPPGAALARGVVFYLVGAALPEETLFRGYLWRRVSEITSRSVWLVLVTAVLFGMMHVPRLIVQGEPLWIVGTLTLVGIVLGVLRAWSGTLPLVVGLHTAIDLLS
ncbi:hypothetical protein GCM10009785_07080 [Brooklawnia cerclae]|uniref:Membrane protease YdiL (CAAX protease family) n=1 Tax=Brooklawnia cerclae TaxID=349934 RepID=A0ABX0SIR4_9ACTN|nr:CPBP family intramembrane glutamic endopeptidase [Brooklawnia cerclae]NIH58287.1 membrane protease YdiL (CAAX protease family) [Brooklawnia cerclae]